MNTAALAQSAYAKATVIAPEPRDVEYRAFARVTRKLSEETDGPDAFPRLATALNENMTLWSTLAQLVADPNNQLPDQLRAQIVYLAEFTQQHTRKVLAGDATTGVLVEINTAIMRGLRARTGGAGE